MIGLHPTSVNENFADELKIVENELLKGKYYAVGEIGIDFYWDKTYAAEQEAALRTQLDLALQFNLPVAIHTRDSFDFIAKIMEDYRNKNLRGVFHCFTGDVKQAKFIIALGFKLGIGGVLTFKNSKLDEVLQHIDIQHIVLETDAPFLSPVPFRGKRNESSFMLKTAEKMATIYQLPLDEIAQKTTFNAKQLFGI